MHDATLNFIQLIGRSSIGSRLQLKVKFILKCMLGKKISSASFLDVGQRTDPTTLKAIGSCLSEAEQHMFPTTSGDAHRNGYNRW